MTEEKLIEEISAIREQVRDNNFMGASAACSRLLDKLKEEAFKSNAKKEKKTKVLQAALRIIKYNLYIDKKTGENRTPDSRRFLCGAGVFDGKQVFCDGYRMVVLSKGNFLNMPQLKEKDEIEAMKLLYNNVMGGYEKVIRGYDEYNLPTKKELDIYIAENRKSKRDTSVYYKIREGYHVNAFYLRDMAILLPEGKCYVEPKNDYKGMYIVSKNGCGLLLPVRISKVADN